MWTCSKCGRSFGKAHQPHSCKKVPIEQHFKNKEKAKELFSFLVERVDSRVGKCKIISLPCCIHLFGKYDFLAALPKRDKLEIRFGLYRKISDPRLIQTVPVSSRAFKNCFEVRSKKDIDSKFIGWVKEAYHLIDA